jgi:hypothetical protein
MSLNSTVGEVAVGAGPDRNPSFAGGEAGSEATLEVRRVPPLRWEIRSERAGVGWGAGARAGPVFCSLPLFGRL